MFTVIILNITEFISKRDIAYDLIFQMINIYGIKSKWNIPNQRLCNKMCFISLICITNCPDNTILLLE